MSILSNISYIPVACCCQMFCNILCLAHIFHFIFITSNFSFLHLFVAFYMYLCWYLFAYPAVNSSVLSSFTCSCHFPLATCHFTSYCYLRNYLQHCIRVFVAYHKVVFIENTCAKYIFQYVFLLFLIKVTTLFP